MSVWDGVSVHGAHPDGTVERIRFRTGPLQGMQMGLFMAVVFMAISIGGNLYDGFPIPSSFWVVVVVYPLFFALVQSGFRTDLTERCLVVPTAFGHRDVPWHTIRAMESERLLGTRTVKIHLVDGTSRRLRVPATGFPYDPNFQRKFGTIQAWWVARRGW